MICDERDRPLDEFETAMLAELLAAQGEFITLTREGGPHANVVTFAAPPRRRRRVLAVVGVAAAVTAATVIVALGSHGATPPRHSSATAAVVLRRMSLVADEQHALSPPAPGQFVYTQEVDLSEVTVPTRSVVEGDADTYKLLEPITRQTWIGPDGSGRIAEAAQGPPTFPSPADKAKWLAAGSPAHPDSLVNETFGPLGVSYFNLSSLPTDSAQLAVLFSEGRVGSQGLITNASGKYVPPSVTEEIGDIGNLLDPSDETYASPALRAALYQVAAGLPGVRLLGTVIDSIGRSGTAVAYSNQGTETVFIFDPTTSALLEQEYVATSVTPAQGAPVGTVLGSQTYITSGVVGSTTATPSTSASAASG
jgi:antitoxin (DNA-binding transcriptional repressor) of toxin-antitoxin stability system